MDVVSRIIEIMNQKGLTGTQLGELLGKKKSPVTDWKNGKSKPTLDQIKIICENFAIPSDYLLFGRQAENITLTDDQAKLISIYTALDHRGKTEVTAFAYKELDRVNAHKELPNNVVQLPANAPSDPEEAAPATTKQLPLYNQPFSAGSGSLLMLHSDNTYEPIEVPKNELTEKASFCVKVDGDSMEPDFYDGDIALVQQRSNVLPEQIGVFVLDGKAYIKKYRFNGKRAYLLSLNDDVYPPMEIDINNQPKPLGKVIGKLKL